MHTTHSLDWNVSIGADGGALGSSVAIGAEGVVSSTSLVSGASITLSRLVMIF